MVGSSRPCGSMMMTRAASPVALSATTTTASARNFTGTTSLRSVGPSETAIRESGSTSDMAWQLDGEIGMLAD